MLPAPCPSGPGAPLREFGAEIGPAPERLGQPFRCRGPGVLATGILISLTQIALKKEKEKSELCSRATLQAPEPAGRVAAPRLPAPPRRLGVVWPSWPVAGAAGAPSPWGWPFWRGAAIRPPSPRRAGARLSGGRGRRRKGWPVAASLRARQRRARWPARRAGPLLQPQSLVSGGWGRRRGRAAEPRPRIAFSDCFFFVLPGQVSLTETGELDPALPCCSCCFKRIWFQGEKH